MRVLLVLVLLAGAIHAESSSSMKGWEIYSWRMGDGVSFALLPGTNRTKRAAEIKKSPLTFAQVKKQLAKLKTGEEVFWSVGDAPTSNQFDLPPGDATDERRQVAVEIQRLGLKLTILPLPQTIGTITMAHDKSIELRLRSLPPGPIAETLLRYKPGDAEYKEMIDHVGGLAPGETKLVPPWPSP
jgi:hypothetical protein